MAWRGVLQGDLRSEPFLSAKNRRCACVKPFLAHDASCLSEQKPYRTFVKALLAFAREFLRQGDLSPQQKRASGAPEPCNTPLHAICRMVAH